jgi:hypothetical protein
MKWFFKMFLRKNFGKNGIVDTKLCQFMQKMILHI